MIFAYNNNFGIVLSLVYKIIMKDLNTVGICNANWYLNEVIASINIVINLFDEDTIIELLYIRVAIRWNIITWVIIWEYSFKTEMKTNYWRIYNFAILINL